jgi:homogentisate 1,2-dioxygenase
MVTVAGAGDPSARHGISVHMYVANESMDHIAFYNSDGDFLIGCCIIKSLTESVPQQGTLFLKTEMGKMVVKPGEICVIQRGIRVPHRHLI